MALPFSAARVAGSVPIHPISAADWPAFAQAKAPSLRALAGIMDFRGQAGRILIAPATDGSMERVLFGLGDKPGPLLFGQLARDLPTGDYHFSEMPADIAPTLAAIGWALGAYVFDRYKPRKKQPPRIALPDGCDEAEARRVAEAVYLVRDLVNTPAADMGPSQLQAAAQTVADRGGAHLAAVIGDALLGENYPMVHAVGRAALDAPRLLHLSWGEKDAPVLALVGKGVTFDSGGLNIKMEGGMRLMKKDMGGAAHVLGLAQLVMDAKLPVRLEVLIPAVENAISGDAFRPGDILRTRKGLTVEVDNTDAEGRLILGDALARACELSPALLLDYATLTGAARTALGPDLPPMFTDDEGLAADFAAASAREADPLWRLPLWNAYDSDMDSPIADLKNTGDGAFAGSIFGGLFLRRFVTAGTAWAHFDVYAWQPRDKPGKPQGGEAHALRASWAVLKKRFAVAART